jgi:hypothetical protein
MARATVPTGSGPAGHLVVAETAVAGHSAGLWIAGVGSSGCGSVVVLFPDSGEIRWDVQGIAAGWAAEPGWWVVVRTAADHLDSPGGMVDEAVVPAAEQDAVGEAGGTAVGPMNDVVAFTPAGRYRTPRKRAPAVSDGHRAADR